MIYPLLAALALSGPADAKKSKAPPPPPQGWHHEEGWKGDCYYPKDYATLGQGDKIPARADALAAMKTQWTGGRDDGVNFDSNVVEDVDTTLLGLPVKIEATSRENLDLCKVAMQSGDMAAWGSWMGGLNGRLNVGECNNPLSATRFDYLELGVGWQGAAALCKGDTAHIFATVQDRYRITEKGAWINVDGTEEPAVGADWPCNIERCTVGKLVGKFTGESGVELVFPIGASANFEAPESGVLVYSINDTTWYDNKWYSNGRIDDHAAVTIEPAGGLQ
ncbi:MAG: hypothetical protein EXR69_12565 [Myxococcales bacterium]|nr:hypothetical protein [Myxococcales bacterium]